MDSPEPPDISGEDEFALAWELKRGTCPYSSLQAPKIPWWRTRAIEREVLAAAWVPGDVGIPWRFLLLRIFHFPDDLTDDFWQSRSKDLYRDSRQPGV